MYSGSRKKDQNFFAISSKELVRLWWNLVHRFLLQSHINVFHFTWIMFLHYLVKLEMLIGHVLPLSCNRKKLQSFSRLNYAPPPKFARFKSSWLQHVRNIAREGVKYASVIWTHWNSDWELSGTSLIMSSLLQPFVSGVVDSSILVMYVLYTVSCNISHMLLSAGFKSGKFWGHSCSGINSGVSFGNKLCYGSTCSI